MEAFIREPIKTGRLNVIAPDGQLHVLKGAAEGPEASIRITDKRLLRRMLVMPDLYLGEAYMEGVLTVEEGSLYDVLDFFACNLMPRLHDSRCADASQRFRATSSARQKPMWPFTTISIGRSLNYFSTATCNIRARTSRTSAKVSKRRRRTRRSALPQNCCWSQACAFSTSAPVLADWRCTWRESFEVEVVGLTLSEEQWRVSQDRARAAGLEKKVAFKLLDYREEGGRYDRIVSVGMFEHVGQSHYDEFFRKIRELMTDDGVCLLHSIGRMAPPGSTSPWLIKYIFPGGYVPSLSETLAAVERAGLWVTDVEILRLHYAETLRQWHQRFQVQSRQGSVAL